MDAPDRTQIIEARQRAGQTQTAAATSVHAALRSWQQWEAGDRAMPAATWELYMLKSGQHPDFIMAPRAGATGSAASLASRPSVDRS